jgi:5'-3' exonuclease
MLIFDGQNVCYRESFSKAGLSHNGKPTGAILGFLRQLRSLLELYPGEVSICWDSRRSLRREFHSEYKANRRNGGEVPEQIQDVFAQIEDLRDHILPRIGYPNQYLCDGYEADDLVAVLCQRPIDAYRVIISSDNDLFQCLGPSVFMHNVSTKKKYTYKDFQEEYGVTPMRWPDVKAIAGDAGDNVIGLPGVGIKTAVRALSPPDAKGKTVSDKVSRMILEYREIIVRNTRLVKLPWEGCDPGEVKKSQFNEREYIRVCNEYGLNSLLR